MIRISGLHYEKNKMSLLEQLFKYNTQIRLDLSKKKVRLVHNPRGIIMAVNKLIK